MTNVQPIQKNIPVEQKSVPTAPSIETPILTPSIETPILTHIEPTINPVNVSIEMSVQTKVPSPIDPIEPQTQTLLKIQRGIKLHQR